MTTFNYLERVMTMSNNDWEAAVNNMILERKNWVQFSSILVWEGADARTSGTFFKAVFQATLLFGS